MSGRSITFGKQKLFADFKDFIKITKEIKSMSGIK